LKCNKKGDFTDFKLLTRIVSEKGDCNELETESDRMSKASLESEATRRFALWKEWQNSEPVQTLANGQFKIIILNAQIELNVALHLLVFKKIYKLILLKHLYFVSSFYYFN